MAIKISFYFVVIMGLSCSWCHASEVPPLGPLTRTQAEEKQKALGVAAWEGVLESQHQMNEEYQRSQQQMHQKRLQKLEEELKYSLNVQQGITEVLQQHSGEIKTINSQLQLLQAQQNTSDPIQQYNNSYKGRSALLFLRPTIKSHSYQFSLYAGHEPFNGDKFLSFISGKDATMISISVDEEAAAALAVTGGLLLRYGITGLTTIVGMPKLFVIPMAIAGSVALPLSILAGDWALLFGIASINPYNVPAALCIIVCAIPVLFFILLLKRFERMDASRRAGKSR